MSPKDSFVLLSRHIWKRFTLKIFYHIIRTIIFLVVSLIKLKAKYYTVRLISETKYQIIHIEHEIFMYLLKLVNII